MRCPRDPRCQSRDTSFFIHQCNVERASLDIPTATIRDIRLVQWTTIATDVSCWFESLGESTVENEQLGRVPVAMFNVWLPPDTDVHATDRLKKGTEYFIVDEVRDFSEEGFHKVAVVRRQPFAS